MRIRMAIQQAHPQIVQDSVNATAARARRT
jgi:hypothetical protein